LQKCVPCDLTCQECTGPTNLDCKSCVSPLIYYNNQCLAGCPDGTFFSSSQISCTNCHQSCATCSGPLSTSCLTCSSGYIISTPTGGCQPCQSPCKTCIGMVSQCTSCQEGYFISSRYQCSMCALNCGLCSGAELSKCERCFSGYFFTSNNQCLAFCPTGTYPDEKSICQPCHSSCRSCYGMREQNCTACQSPKYLQNNTCLKSCPDWKYENHETRVCEDKIPITIKLEALKNPSIFKLTLTIYPQTSNDYLEQIIKESAISVGELYSFAYKSSFRRFPEEQGAIYIYITFLKPADLTNKHFKLFAPKTVLQEKKYFYKYQPEGYQVPLENLTIHSSCNTTDAVYKFGKINRAFMKFLRWEKLHCFYKLECLATCHYIDL
jgi:hypothetical protein